jgi:pyrroloquinoline quinone biosynthesis protein D
MTPVVRPAFERGVRLRTEDDGSAMLLVPEGAVKLNASAAAALALVNGERTLDEIVAEICARFDVADERARDDVTALFERLRLRRMLVLS